VVLVLLSFEVIDLKLSQFCSTGEAVFAAGLGQSRPDASYSAPPCHAVHISIGPSLPQTGAVTRSVWLTWVDSKCVSLRVFSTNVGSIQSGGSQNNRNDEPPAVVPRALQNGRRHTNARGLLPRWFTPRAVKVDYAGHSDFWRGAACLEKKGNRPRVSYHWRNRESGLRPQAGGAGFRSWLRSVGRVIRLGCLLRSPTHGEIGLVCVAGLITVRFGFGFRLRCCLLWFAFCEGSQRLNLDDEEAFCGRGVSGECRMIGSN